MGKEFLYDYQRDAVDKLRCGCVLNGGVGSGKSRTGLYYYFKENGGSIVGGDYTPMSDPVDLYIITTAMKRNKLEWDEELLPYRLSPDPELNYYDNKVVIDSWNNIKKYVDVKNAFFILDECHITGFGTWTKAFLKIAKANQWIVLSATPADNWLEFTPLFIANGFYKNKTEFITEHVIYSRFSKYPKVERFVNTGRLLRLKSQILVDMDFQRQTVRYHEDIYCSYDSATYKQVMKMRWDPFKFEPIQQASGLCYVLRRIVNSDFSRQSALLKILDEVPKAIIFYSFDYELDILLNLKYIEGTEVAQYNGHIHEPLPTGDRWVYLVNYTGGCEGWNAITTDTVIFYSQSYSYKQTEQACGRIDRVNTPYRNLRYYHLKSRSGIDVAISKALSQKKNFNEARWVGWS